MPLYGLPLSGPSDMRPRVGFSPTSPQNEAGLRIDPPPSPPVAIGTTPAATAAADPPLEPAVLISRFQGFLVAPVWRDVVSSASPNSDVVVRPRLMNPAFRSRRITSVSFKALKPAASSDPISALTPASSG